MQDSTKYLLGAAAYTYIKQNYPSADAKLAYRGTQEQLEYQREKDLADRKSADELARYTFEQQNRDRDFQKEQAFLDRREQAYQAAEDRRLQEEMQRREHEMREQELEMERERIEAERYMAEVEARAKTQIANQDREAENMRHLRRIDHERQLMAAQLDQRERLEQNKLKVKQNIANQQETLQRYLFEQGNLNTQEIEKFKALALRETQILMARENAYNILQDRMVQDALKDFPLNVSPLVLLKNKPHELTNLLRFTKTSNEPLFLPDIANVYADVKNYAKNPEPLNIFIAPIHISSSISEKDTLTKQIWDIIYQKVESFFTTYYSRNSDHPVVFYPTSWKDSSKGGQHASETLHFFLKDIPCLVIEPRFDGHSLNLIISGWNNGYLSSDHIRVQMTFEMNLYSHILESAYERSVKSLSLLNELGEGNLDDTLKKKKQRLEKNIRYFETLDLKKRISENDLSDIEELGVYDLFDITPNDLKKLADNIAEIISINLAVISDAHHLQATDAEPIFPTIFKAVSPEFFNNEGLKQQLADSYERVYLYLRNVDANAVEPSQRRGLERVREMQITNVRKHLELISEESMMKELEQKLRQFGHEKYGLNGLPFETLTDELVARMERDDIPFYSEILPNISERRLYKRIDKKIGELQR